MTGDIETVGKLNAGDQYSLTVQATDKGGLFTQAIVEVKISPGPNTQPPVFEQSIYNIEVSEGATINSTALTMKVRISLYLHIVNDSLYLKNRRTKAACNRLYFR